MAYKCECGRSFSTKSGLTLHKKKCKVVSDNNSGENVMPNNGAIALKKDTLTSADKAQFRQLINRRQEDLLKALNEEMQNGKEDSILELTRREYGQVYSPSDIKGMLEGINEQIDAEKKKHIAPEKQRIEIKRAEVIEDFNEREEELKKRHKEEFRALHSEKQSKLQAIRTQLIDIEKNIVKEHAAPLLERKAEYQAQLAKAEQEELAIQAKAKHRTALIKRSKGRLEHSLRNNVARALEDLLMNTTTHAEAKMLLERIPTVADALEKCSTADGIEELFRIIDPNMSLPSLPAPENTKPVIDIDEVAEASVSADNSDEEQDFEEANEDREWHVYRS